MSFLWLKKSKLEDRRKIIKSMKDLGHTNKDIYTRLGISKARFYQIIKQLGYKSTSPRTK